VEGKLNVAQSNAEVNDGNAVDRVHSVLSACAPEVGPFELDEDGDPDPSKPMPDAILAEWVVVMAWTDAKTGHHFTTRLTSRDLPRHHEDGLLHQALFQFE